MYEGDLKLLMDIWVEGDPRQTELNLLSKIKALMYDRLAYANIKQQLLDLGMDFTSNGSEENV